MLTALFAFALVQSPDPALETVRAIDAYIGHNARCSEHLADALGNARAAAFYQEGGPYMTAERFETAWIAGLARVDEIAPGDEGTQYCLTEVSRRARIVEANLRRLRAALIPATRTTPPSA